MPSPSKEIWFDLTSLLPRFAYYSKAALRTAVLCGHMPTSYATVSFQFVT